MSIVELRNLDLYRRFSILSDSASSSLLWTLNNPAEVRIHNQNGVASTPDSKLKGDKNEEK